MYKLEGKSEEDLKAQVIDHFLNTLEVDHTKLIEEVLSIGRDNNLDENNKR